MRLQTVLLAALIALSAGCSTSHAIYDERGQQIIMVECGAGTSISVCYDRATKECPNGYRMISEDSGFNRKTLKVQCK